MNDSGAARELVGAAARTLGVSEARLDLSLLYQGPLQDSTRVFAVRRDGARPSAVLLWSPAAAPDAVASAMRRAEAVAAQLPSDLSRRVLRPLAQGRVDGASYAVLPFCYRLSGFRPLWALQRRLLRPVLAEWLAGTAAATARVPSSEQIEAAFLLPLRRLAASDAASARMKAAADAAARRIDSGHWAPKHVLMHGDLWRGNVMVRAPLPGGSERWGDRVAMIDWAGARLDGYAIFDLVRIMADLRFPPRAAREALLRHGEILQCERDDIASHLCAGLAHVHAHLGEFPLARFLAMGEACLDTAGAALSA